MAAIQRQWGKRPAHAKLAGQNARSKKNSRETAQKSLKVGTTCNWTFFPSSLRFLPPAHFPPPDSLASSLEELARCIGKRDAAGTRHIADYLHHADLASLYEELGEEERGFLTGALGTDTFSEILPELPDTLVEEALGQFDPGEQRQILEAIPDDDRVDVLQDVSEEKQDDLLDLLGKEDKDVTRNLLRYGEDTAGGRMTTRAGRLLARMTVKEALDHLRNELESTETINRIFVVDASGQLLGKIRLRDLAFSTWDTPVSSLLRPVEHTIQATDDQEEAAAMFMKYGLYLLPVTDFSGRFLGVITHDDILEVIEEESTEDIEKAAGISGESSEETYLHTPVITHFRRRFGWLLVLALLAIASGYVMLRFEHVLANIFLLSLFLPMVIAAGGNTGGQAATMVIRSMALGELELADTLKVAWKELRLGLLLGLFLGQIGRAHV